MPLRSLRRRAFDLFAILPLFGLLAPSQLMLCTAERGHRALELVPAAQCHAATFDAGGVAAVRDDGCPENCSDTPVAAGVAIIKQIANHDCPSTALSPLLSSSTPSLIMRPTASRRSPGSFVASVNARALRTVVILA